MRSWSPQSQPSGGTALWVLAPSVCAMQHLTEHPVLFCPTPPVWSGQLDRVGVLPSSQVGTLRLPPLEAPGECVARPRSWVLRLPAPPSLSLAAWL